MLVNMINLYIITLGGLLHPSIGQDSGIPIWTTSDFITAACDEPKHEEITGGEF